MERDGTRDGEPYAFSPHGYVIGAVIVALAATFLGLALVTVNPLASGVVLAAGAVVDGRIAHRVGARGMAPHLYGLAAVVLIAAVLLSWTFRMVR